MLQKNSKNGFERVEHEFERRRNRVFHRHPFVFTVLVAFGIVATFYGFEGIIDRTNLQTEHPFLLASLGILVLLFTGSLYKRLGR